MKVHRIVPVFLMLAAINQAKAQTPYSVNPDLIPEIVNYVKPSGQVKKQAKKIEQIKQIRKDDKKTKLLPIEWKGNINPISDAWSTGTTLTGSKLYINGPFYGDLKAIDSKRDTIDAYLEYADKNKVIKQFNDTNLKLKSGLLKKALANYKELPREYAHIFKDGKLLTKDELDLVNGLKDGKYIFTYLYRSKDKKASLPGIFIIDKQEKNFDYEYLRGKDKEKAWIKEGKKRLDETKKRKKFEDLKKRLYDEKIPDVGKSKEDKEISTNYEIGIGYDGDEFYNIELRFGNRFRIGPAFGYSPENEREIKTPIINNFYGDGSELSKKYFLGISAGLDLSEHISSNVAVGIETESKKVDERIRRTNGEIVSQNIDSYSDKNLRGYLGLDYKFNNNFSVGPRFVYSNKAKRIYAGLMARLRF